MVPWTSPTSTSPAVRSTYHYHFTIDLLTWLTFRNPNSTLINGLGRYAGGPASDLAVITVQQGKRWVPLPLTFFLDGNNHFRYRFRLISMACEPNFNFTIDNHQLTVIEADGVSTQPLRVDTIPIFAAQRYSFVVNLCCRVLSLHSRLSQLNADQPIGNYWVRALPNLGTKKFDGGLNSAILRYMGAAVQEPTTNPNLNPFFLQETDLHPLVFNPVVGFDSSFRSFHSLTVAIAWPPLHRRCRCEPAA